MGRKDELVQREGMWGGRMSWCREKGCGEEG